MASLLLNGDLAWFDSTLSTFCLSFLFVFKFKKDSSELGSLSNAVCFKHDNDVGSCAVRTLIPHLSQICHQKFIQRQRYLAICCVRWKFSRPTQLFVYSSDFSLRMRNFDHIYTSGLNSVVDELSASVFLQRRCHFRRATTVSATFVTVMSAHVC